MSSAAQADYQYRVRILNGPLEGRTFPVGDGVEIGRSSRADIQLVDDGVSRAHARIRRTANGRHQLEDLESANGTMVDELRIRRQLLAPCMVFTVWKTRFIYEDERAEECGDEPTGLRVATGDARVRRDTIVYPSRQLRLVSSSPEPGRDPDTPIRRRRRRALAPTESLNASHLRLIVDANKTPKYPGDLVSDILDYRGLRARMLRGDLLGRNRLNRLGSLEQRMRCIPDDAGAASDKRTYQRYRCRLAAELKLPNDDTFPVMLVELGANGVRIHAPGHRLVPGMEVSVAAELLREGRPATVLFRSRIVWTQHSHAGLQFIRDSISSRIRSRAPDLKTRPENAAASPQPALDPSSTHRWARASSGGI